MKRILPIIFLVLFLPFVLLAQVKKTAPKKPAKKGKEKPALNMALPGRSLGEGPDSAKSVFKTPPKKPKGLTRILFIFDDSQSMLGHWQTGAKIDIAKKLLGEILDSLKNEDELELALRVYGHQKKYPPRDCDDSRLEVPFAKNNIGKIKNVLFSLTPKGTTPIARSLEACANDFPKTVARNIVILITDGLEECEGDPCAVSQALQKKGVILKPFIIGVGTTAEFQKQFECVGTYFDGNTEDTFKRIMSVVISQALNNTTAQVNLLDINRKPSETNVAMTFYDKIKGNTKYNFIHTINSHGNPDTLKLDPLFNYRLQVHTIPPIFKDSIKILPGKHNIISLEAAQGDLELKFDAGSDYKSLMAIVRQAGNHTTLNVQDFNTKERYLVGKYDLEILCLPRINLKNVDISQSHTTTIKIEGPGIATFVCTQIGYGSVYTEVDNKLTWVANLNQNTSRQNLLLQPGNYRVIFRSRSAKETIYTVEKTFKVSTGSSTSIILN